MRMQAALAKYVQALADALARTHEANDRPVYQLLLAEAGALLSRAVLGASNEEMLPLLKNHERTRGHTWIRGPEDTTISAAWEMVVAEVSRGRR